MNNQQRIKELSSRLEEALSPSVLEIVDESADHIGHPGARSGAGHFALTIAAPCFEGKSRVATHQLIYAAVGDLIPHEVHALRISLVKESP